MERKGGCCLAPRHGGAAAAQQAAGAAWQMGRIMLKFRPIAPKPAAMARAPIAAPGRGKRKAVRGGGGRRGRKPKKAATVPAVAAAPPVGDCKDDKDGENEKPLPSRSSSSSGMTSVDTSPPPPPQLATLALLPVSPSPAEDEAAVDAATEEPASLVSAPAAGAQSMPPAAAAAAAFCWVTVEEVTGTWRDGEAPSSAACVGSGADAAASAFVSDQWGRVTWRNAAFGRLVMVSADGGDEEAPVVLAGAHPAWGTCAGFTCRVRVRRIGSSVVAPCDVCRLDAAGCYLWRLDLLAALTLGRLP
ncbi:hypothetical protein BS78_07G187900 [Paspalum vaginatum]|nr:hypothetical protein BS78_07G187900 [Paspalum vaginatum]KAJ1269139.1 hypothetical protein BS78_07G187900 [Paspalum vaginatum]KAJ1269140.1 hypothetical protein BS78_07G187900 [Paspalum vaginatum]KAJ1269141.1 hypothetical protein BS78_07G187900 [Paspalum vaginatum]KAJ1269142.1 hypothetical protein BS78_07G187900 [Paspalum vaginatum]